ncbi:MAG: hypothetical protein QNL12_13275 [Acidimicrobiia bacterium]|nr:hypothetical protein [Acidimicrobiia bacterium]MDX2468284.1 hypothetical protein [Acidimicrobiia bacterium]
MPAADFELAARTAQMNVSAIREILKVVARPGIISLAGGIPSPESFPMESMGHLISNVFDKYGSGSLQYDLTEGFSPLRAALSDLLAETGVVTTANEVLIASG